MLRGLFHVRSRQETSLGVQLKSVCLCQRQCSAYSYLEMLVYAVVRNICNAP